MAIDICDRNGAAALTMRRVALDLGVGVMSLYWYVPTKNELELLIRERIMTENSVLERATGNPREDLANLARAARQRIVRHPWVIDVWSRHPEQGETIKTNTLIHHIETSLEIVQQLPLDAQHQGSIVALVDNYALGFAMDEVGEHRAIDQPTGHSINEVFGTDVVEADYPRLTQFLASAVQPDADTRFEWGLNALLDGIWAMIDRQPSP